MTEHEEGNEQQSEIQDGMEESEKSEPVVNGHATEDVQIDAACGFGVLVLPGQGYKIVPLQGRVEDDNFIPYNFERDPNDDDVLMCVTYMHEFMNRKLLAAETAHLIASGFQQQKIVAPKRGFRIPPSR